MADRLGDMLVAQGVVDEAQLGKATTLASNRRISVGQALVELGMASEAEVWRILAKEEQLPFVDLDADLAKGGRIKESVLDLVPEEIVHEHRVMPVTVKSGSLILAIDDPEKTYEMDTLRFVLDRDVKAALATPSGLGRAMAHYYGEGGDSGVVAEAMSEEEEGDDAPIIRLVSKGISEAVEQDVSDIHVEPMEDAVRIRFRKDGVLREVASHPGHLHGPLSSRLKIMASMDIAEKRKPQDGRIKVKVQGRPIDIRTSVLPSNHGETVVMRLLDKERGLVSLAELGFGEKDLERFADLIKRPNGIILVTGPTGSGKTTSLYAALKELNRPDVKIITAEDPVEYELPGINQVQVRSKIDLTFGRVLRAMLRQAPNVILVGEIRDLDTAEVAIQAALTGHLVFSTLHTNDAPSALARLADMGVKPFLVSAAIQGIMAQRLVRQLCSECKVVDDPEESELQSVGLERSRLAGRSLYRPKGCADCSFSGYRGRIGLFELLEMDGALRDLCFREASTIAIRDHAEQTGRLSSLREDGVRKILDGVTTIAEVLRVVHAVE